MAKPSIRERLDYVEICNVAVEESKRISEASKGEPFGQTHQSDLKNTKRWQQLRTLIIEDLIKDPAFVEYSSYLAPEEKQTIIKHEQNSIITNSQQSDSKDIQTATPEPHEPSSYEEYVEMFGEENTSLADYYSRYRNNADYTPAFDPYLDSRYPSGQFVDQSVDDALRRAGRK